MQKGYIKFSKPTKFNGRRFKMDEIVSVDELKLTRAQFKALVEQRAVVWASTNTGMSYGPSVLTRN